MHEENEENEEKTLRGSADPRQLLKEILSVAVSRRETAACWERFRSLELAELLLGESERDQDASPARSRELAWTAQLVAEQVYQLLLTRLEAERERHGS